MTLTSNPINFIAKPTMRLSACFVRNAALIINYEIWIMIYEECRRFVFIITKAIVDVVFAQKDIKDRLHYIWCWFLNIYHVTNIVYRNNILKIGEDRFWKSYGLPRTLKAGIWAENSEFGSYFIDVSVYIQLYTVYINI